MTTKTTVMAVPTDKQRTPPRRKTNDGGLQAKRGTSALRGVRGARRDQSNAIYNTMHAT